MTKKIILLSCTIWAIVAIWGASPAHARFVIPALPGLEGVTKFVPTGRPIVSHPIVMACEVVGNTVFYYQQFITIPGFGNIWANIESHYPPGSGGALEVDFVGTCEDDEGNTYYQYELDSCGC